MKTYQDLQAAGDKAVFIDEAIREHKGSSMYRIAVNAEMYDRKQNVTIMAYQKLLYTLRGDAVPDRYSANNKIVSAFFTRFVTQQNAFSFANGVTLQNPENKKKLGEKFDAEFNKVSRSALVQGVAFGFFNRDHLEAFKYTEFVPLADERSNKLMAGIRFWPDDPDKPLHATLYEPDGFTDYVKDKTGKFVIEQAKRGYKQNVAKSEADGIISVTWENYKDFPIVRFWGNPHHQSELIGLRGGIDAYDLIKSQFANDLDDVSQIYWTLQNAGGMDDDVTLAQFVERMKTVKAALLDPNQKAEAHTIDIPYAAREAILDRIQKDLYRDAQLLDVESLSASAKTTVEIRAAYEAMNNKADQFEYCALEFLDGIFKIAEIDDTPTFTRSMIANTTEQMQTLLMAAQYLSRDYIVRKICAILGDPDAAEEIINALDETEMQRFGQMAQQQNEPTQEQFDAE